MFEVIVNEKNYQSISYNVAHLPIQCGMLNLSGFSNNKLVCHWHNQIEFIAVQSGEMDFTVNKTTYHLTEKKGIIIWPNQLHYAVLSDQSDCSFISVLVSPNFICDEIDSQDHFINSLPCHTLILNSQTDWQADLLTQIPELYQLSLYQPLCYELSIRGNLNLMWAEIYKHVSTTKHDEKIQSQKLINLKHMIVYVQKNYKNKISLQNISSAGFVSQSVCCRIFNVYLQQTPFTYLINYRVEKSLQYLQVTNMNIAEIAEETGFSNSSYYSECFRKYYHMSPREYRRQFKSQQKI